MKTAIVTFAFILIALAAGLYFNRDTLGISANANGNKADIGGQFTLTDQNGKAFTGKDLKGKYSLVFFGFTHCPGICPMTLANMTDVIKSLGDKAGKINMVFVSVDSGRDDPKAMKAFLNSFSPNIIGLTGTEEQIKQAAKSYKVYYAKVQQPDAKPNDYMMDHTTLIYFMDRNGEYISHFSADDSAEKLIAGIKPYL